MNSLGNWICYCTRFEFNLGVRLTYIDGPVAVVVTGIRMPVDLDVRFGIGPVTGSVQTCSRMEIACYSVVRKLSLLLIKDYFV